MILNMCAPEPPAFGQVAKQFAISERTFQRRLMEEGFSFRDLLVDIDDVISFFSSFTLVSI